MESINSDQEDQSQDSDEQQEQQIKKQDNASKGQNIEIDSNKIEKDKMLLEEENSAIEEQPSTSKNFGQNIPESILKLKDSTKTLGERLSKKLQQLEERQKVAEVLKDKRLLKENNVKVVTDLQSMSAKTAKNLEQSAVNQMPSSVINKSNSEISNNDEIKPLHKHTKRQLECLVEGLQELICKLTMNDYKLKSRVNRLARKISSLQNFPIFSNVSLYMGPSTSLASRQRLNSGYYEEDRIQHKLRHNMEPVNDEHEQKKERKWEEKREKVDKTNPTEIFTKYINDILAEYLGDQQKDKMEKYKCLPSYIEDLETYALSLVEAGFGRVVEAEIRINRKNSRQAFVTMSSDRETDERDGIILVPVARRYAFDGDTVRAFVFNTLKPNETCNREEGSSLHRSRKIFSHITGGNLDNSISLTEDDELREEIAESEFEDCTELLDTSLVLSENCRKAFVTKIVKQTELREVVGSISFANTTKLKSKTYYKLKPHDMKIPMVYIPEELCTVETNGAKKEDICDLLYVARILETDISGKCIGELMQPVGKIGDLQAEIKAILLHNGFKDIKPYEQKFQEMYEGPMSPPTEKDLRGREDLRKKCIFTIDPLTARDLDDAVSVEKLNDKEYEIGVHISDVSYFLTENSELDNLVKDRATSIYLVTEVIHMLPPSLCFRCSLLPGEDKFAFSVFWKWHTDREEISAPRFTRSIINSCSQFAYEHAQKIIDNPKEDFDHNDFPDIFNEWTPSDIKWRVLILHHIAQKLKARRYENGALSINIPKLRFQLDPTTCEPLAYEVEGRQEANFLIEEFMLLANQSVAKFIYERFPDISILRNHAPPLQKSMKALKDRLNKLGLELNITSSKMIYESMQRIISQASDQKAVEACLNTFLTKPMSRAKYYCSEGKTTDADFCHYALSIPIYTHFTSPIRRYPDILVHRLLAAALEYCPPPKRTTDELHYLAKICNDQKLNAKCAGDESVELFFKRYVKAKQSITLKAVVSDINKYDLNVVTIATGHKITITYKMQNVQIDTSNVPSFVVVSERNSQLPPLKLQVFSTVNINLVITNGQLNGFIVSADPIQRLNNCQESSKQDNRKRLQRISISEQEDHNSQTTSSSKSKNKRKLLRLKKKESDTVDVPKSDQ